MGEGDQNGWLAYLIASPCRKTTTQETFSMNKRRVATWFFSTMALVPMCAAHATGESDPYPNKPIRFVVPFAPGGGTDIVARQIAIRLSKVLGQSIIVDNRPGAATVVGTEYTVRSAPDGYTIMEGSASLAITPSTRAKLPYNALKDLAPIAQTASQAYVVVVNPNSSIKSIHDLLVQAKAHPGKLTFGSPGPGSGGHLATELFKVMGHVDLRHVPYKGDSPALTDVMGGQIDVMFSTISPALPLVRAGKLRAIGITTAKRAVQLPDVPTVAEAGVPDYEAASWNGVLAPANTPKPIIDRLSMEIAKILQAPDMQKWFQEDGAEPGRGTPEDFAALIRANTEKWAKVVKEAGIQPE
jgi:tripartite-type tricarboxylate transporter receptor subunit TctC